VFWRVVDEFAELDAADRAAFVGVDVLKEFCLRHRQSLFSRRFRLTDRGCEIDGLDATVFLARNLHSIADRCLPVGLSRYPNEVNLRG
jgi:hypothetical protein